MRTMTFRVRVAKKQVEAVDICSFELADVDSQPLPAFSAGSHIDVQVADELTRQYWLCETPRLRERYVTVPALPDTLPEGRNEMLTATLAAQSRPRRERSLACCASRG
jgi:vanillate O-demethylase ferredoxin subunit